MLSYVGVFSINSLSAILLIYLMFEIYTIQKSDILQVRKLSLTFHSEMIFRGRNLK